ncbi:AAWKG family protein [Streptomyces sp. NPDC056656]|uniref:AAWKG family protein n=1 Tax=Streptomyces sp. NPDC056656 TaxID=3345895 RepID=UPI003693AA58
MPADLWASAVQLLTGYPMPDRSTLFQDLAGTDEKTPLMNVKVESLGSVATVYYFRNGVGPNVEGHSYVLGYYTTDGDKIDLKKITIDFLWNPAERPAQPGTPLDQYIFGPLNMLNGIVNTPFSTQGRSYGGLVVDPQNAVNLRTFSDVAGAYDRTFQYFSDEEAVLKQWADSLGHKDADMKGTAADAFAALIRRMEENYKGYKEQLLPPGFSAKNYALLPVNGRGASLTKQGDSLIGAANAVHQSSYDLVMAWYQWAANAVSNPIQALSNLIYEIAVWIQGNNLGQANLVTERGSGAQYHMEPGGSFQQNHPTWGDLTQIDTWGNIGKKAVQLWTDAVESMLVPAANRELSDVNNAFIDATAVLTNPLVTKNTSPIGSDGKGGKDGNDGKGGDDGNQSWDDILKKLGLGGDDGKNGKDGKGGDNKTKIPPPDLKDPGDKGGNGADETGGKDGTGGDGGKNGGVPDPKEFLKNVPAPDLNNPGGNGSGGGLNNGSGLNVPGGVPGGIPGTTGSGNPNTTTRVPAPNVNLAGLPGSGLPGSGLPGSELPGGTNPDGSPIVPGLPNSTLLGSKPPTLKNQDGSGTPVAFPDGSTRTVLPDGSVLTTSPDGTKVTRSPDGTILTEKPDGTKVTAKPDGTTTTVKPDGTKRVLHPGGVTTLTDPDGNTSYLGPDGKPLGERPDLPLTTPQLPGLNSPGFDLPGVSGAGGGVPGGSGGTYGGGGNSLLANPPSYEEAGYDLSTDFPDYGSDALGSDPNALGGVPGGNPATGVPPMMPPGMGAGGMGGAGGGMGGGDRVREFTGDPAGSPNRMAQGPGQGTGGTPPYMPPPGGQQGGQQTQSSDRERANWLAEEEDVWGTEDEGNPAVLGREEPSTTGAKRNAFMTGEG